MDITDVDPCRPRSSRADLHDCICQVIKLPGNKKNCGTSVNLTTTIMRDQSWSVGQVGCQYGDNYEGKPLPNYTSSPSFSKDYMNYDFKLSCASFQHQLYQVVPTSEIGIFQYHIVKDSEGKSIEFSWRASCKATAGSRTFAHQFCPQISSNKIFD